MNLPYQSQALQDRFVAKILNFKRDGYFLDIGSCHSISTNNTYALEQGLGWKGICIEMDPQHNQSYEQRNCIFINVDATKIDYQVLLNNFNAPGFIDYLSLDVDAASTEVLKRLPLDKYKFKIITVEHDAYIHQGIYRDQQRAILIEAGYRLYCKNVLVPLQDDTKPDSDFEDWWVHTSIFLPCPMNERMYPKDIIAQLG